MIVYIDGPEKAGKTTLIAHLLKSKRFASVRHWGPVNPDDREFAPELYIEAISPEWHIWDRSWVSEHVYGTLLNRDRRIVYDPMLGEWIHGRYFGSNGLKFILLPLNNFQRANLLDDTDLPVDPFLETNAYFNYAKTYAGYRTLFNDYYENSITLNANIIFKHMDKMQQYIHDVMNNKPSLALSGNIMSDYVIIDSEKNYEYTDDKLEHAGALPFCTQDHLKLAKMIGNRANNLAYVNVDQINKINYKFFMDKINIVIGEHANDIVQEYASGSKRFVVPFLSSVFADNLLTKYIQFIGEQND